MKDFTSLATDQSLNKTVDSLKANGINSIVVENEEEAKEKVLSMLPTGAEIMPMTSVTLESVGLTEALIHSDKFENAKENLKTMDRETQGLDMQRIGAAPEWALGSVHAVTQDGHVFIASNTGSQLPAYVYGASHVIWVVGTQKIVADDEEAKDRIYQYVLPLESDRANKAYSITTGSNVSKLLVINREINPNRITIVFVKKALGF